MEMMEWLQLVMWLIGVFLVVLGVVAGASRFFLGQMEKVEGRLTGQIDTNRTVVGNKLDALNATVAKQNGSIAGNSTRIALLEGRPLVTKDVCDILHAQNREQVARNEGAIRDLGKMIDTLSSKVTSDLIPALNRLEHSRG